METPALNGTSHSIKVLAINGHSIRHDTVDSEKLFDGLNQTYSDAYEKNTAQVQCMDRLLSMLSPGSQVLDIGSGTGLPATSMLASAGMNVTGIDKSSAMIDVARKNVPAATFHRTDMRQFQPLDGQKYDAIVANLSILMVSTSTIREMAFKIAHWLKPGGLLMLGIIDWTDIDQADGWSADPYNEWLNHHFMGEVIKDNLFGIGQWISLLRSADIALIDAKGAVFEAADQGILVEPECFFIGRKGDKEALMGPLRVPVKHVTELPFEVQASIERYLVPDAEGLKRLLADSPEYSDVSLLNSSQEEHSVAQGDEIVAPTIAPDGIETTTPVNGTNIVANGTTTSINGMDAVTNGTTTSTNGNGHSSPHHLQGGPRSTKVFIQPSPSNDVVTMVNNVASFFNLPIVHTGEGLRARIAELQSDGYQRLHTSILGDEFLDFSRSQDVIEDLTQLIRQVFKAHEHTSLSQAIELGVRAQVERYLANQQNFGNPSDRLGYQRVVLIARKD